jgi:UDP-N-acetyl-D-mannosaminuronic acid transferase (WecB/TagA/CpsF family)
MHFLSLDIINTRYQDFLDTLFAPTRPTLIFTPNPEMLLRAARDTEFLAILSQADVLTPDANGLYTASLMQEGSGFLSACLQTLTMKNQLRAKYGDIITGSNLTRDLVDHAIESGKRILMIDNYLITEPQNPFEVEKKLVQSRLRELFRERYPDLDITVVFDGGQSPEQLAELIQEQDISYVFSCIGMRKQEQRLIEIWTRLPQDFPVVGL